MNVILKNRQMQIPGGFKFEIPEIGFRAAPYQSFDTLVNQVLRVTRGNMELSQKKGWPTEKDGVVMWVDQTNAMMCQRSGWKDYIIENRDLDPPKFPPPPAAHPAAAVVAGAKSLVDWFGAGAQPVEMELAEKRALVCSTCPENRMGDFGNWFSRSVSEVIRLQIGAFRGRNLTTSLNDKLGVCDSCSCPLKLKVFVPMEHIQCHLPPGLWSELPAHCWMLTEKRPPLGDK